MDENLHRHQDAFRSLSKSLSERWLELCARYLSLTREDSFWRYSRARMHGDLEQGWKLHISATVLTANKVLEAIGPFLQGRGVLFKGPSSLHEVGKLNSGSYYGYTQVGKCFTVYPQTTEEAVALAEKLHELTSGIPAPAVPFDMKFRPNSCIYYRYGAFKYQGIGNEDGTYTLVVRNPEGKLVPDLRDSPTARPDWITDPFPGQPPADADQLIENPLKTTFRAFRALTQRGKGGVYQAVDISVKPPRFCLLKEGRRDGEPSWDGRDGYWRVKHEEKVLGSLSALGIDVPHLYSSFEVEGNYYLATEFVEGISLQTLLNKRWRRLAVRRALAYGLQLSSLISQIHSAGWVWRDCKPTNLIVTKRGTLRPVDFEGACTIQQPDPLPWGTPAFVPPESGKGFCGQSRAPEDLYALGVLIYLLLSGSLPSAPTPIPVEKLRRSIPVAARQIVSELLDPEPERRPGAQLVAQRLKAALLSINVN